MKVTEQLKAMDMMAVNPIARVVAPRFWGGVHLDAAAGRAVLGDGHLRRLADRRGGDRRR
jgi:hypothetical protein